MRLNTLFNLKFFNKLIFSQRCFSSNTQNCVSIIYGENGDPIKVLDLIESKLGMPKKNEVLIRMLASPINPADINMLQGVYPIKPKLPAIGGNEGVGEVLEVGANVKDLKKGDWVLPAAPGWGTWRSHAICEPKQLVSVSNSLSVLHAATLAVNPCTAYRMLKDFENLKEGDVVIQNAANSAVGQAVIQIAKELGLRTINIVRQRDDIEMQIARLQNLGGTHVVTDEFLRSQAMKDLMKKLPKPKLALNCVGGKVVAELVKHLDQAGSLVTYGGMSKQPLMIATSSFIFKDLKAYGFWMTRWTEENQGSEEQKEMLDWLTALCLSGKFKVPDHQMRPPHEYREAVACTMQEFQAYKQIFTFQDAAKLF